MTRRDNKPSNKSTKRKLLQNTQELINKFRGNRRAFIDSMERLQKRIRKVEEEENIKIDVEQLPRYIREYIQYGAVPNRVQKTYIDDAERLRKKQLIGLSVDTSFWEGEDSPIDRGVQPSDEQPARIAEIELQKLRNKIDQITTRRDPTRLKAIGVELHRYINEAIELMGDDAFMKNLANNSQIIADIIDSASNYSPGSEGGQHHLQNFWEALTGKAFTKEMNILDTYATESYEGDSYMI